MPNVCYAVWKPTKDQVMCFMTYDGISFKDILNGDVAEIICAEEGRTPLIDYILRGDKEKEGEMIEFVRQVLNFQYVDKDTIVSLMDKASKEFREKHKEPIECIRQSKDFRNNWGWHSSFYKKYTPLEIEVKRLFLFVVMLEKQKLFGEDKDFAIKKVDELLGGAITNIGVHDNTAKISRENRKQIDALRTDVDRLDDDIDALKIKTSQHDRRLDEHDKVLTELRMRVDQVERRMASFDRLKNGLFRQVIATTVDIHNRLSTEDDVSNEDYQKLYDLMDKSSVDLKQNSDLGDQFAELSTRFSGIETFVSTLADRVDVLSAGIATAKAADHKHADDIVKLQQQRGEMLKLLIKVQSDVKELSTTYEAQFDGFLDGYFDDREKQLLDSYRESWPMGRYILECAHPDVDFKKAKKKGE